MNILTLINVVLESEGYRVFADPICSSVLLDRNSKITMGRVKRAVENSNLSSILRLNESDFTDTTDMIIAVRPKTNEVWLIPISDISSLTMIRLGKRWENYKFTVSVQKEREIEADMNELKASVLSAASRLIEESINGSTKTDKV